MTTLLSVRGKTQTDCPKCGAKRIRAMWHTDCQTGITERRRACPDCHWDGPVQKIDRRVYSHLAPEDALYLHDLCRLADNTVVYDQNGNTPMVRNSLTEIRQKLNRMPPHLRKKLDL